MPSPRIVNKSYGLEMNREDLRWKRSSYTHVQEYFFKHVFIYICIIHIKIYMRYDVVDSNENTVLTIFWSVLILFIQIKTRQ